jgi:hypothetical protein
VWRYNPHILTSALDGGEWSASHPRCNLNPHHVVVKQNPLNRPYCLDSPPYCAAFILWPLQVQYAAPCKSTEPVIIYDLNCNKHITTLHSITLTSPLQLSYIRAGRDGNIARYGTYSAAVGTCFYISVYHFPLC